MPMAVKQGSSSYFAYKKEGTANTEETGAGGAKLRRVSGTLNPQAPEVNSAEKRDDFQEVNVTQGVRSVAWSIDGELYSGDYEEFVAAGLRKDFATVAAVSASSGDGFTISSGVLTRAAGGSESFLDDGVKVGHVGRLASMAVTGNNSRNLLVTAATATTLTLVAVDGGAAVADDATDNTSATFTVTGQTSYIPSSSHTSDTFTIEKHDTNTDTSRVGVGCRVGSLNISQSENTAPSLTFSGEGTEFKTYSAGSAPSLTSPTDTGTGGLMAPTLGYIRVNGSEHACITSYDVTVDTGLSSIGAVGSTNAKDTVYGRTASVTGTLNGYIEDNSIVDLFTNETEFELVLFAEAPGSAPKAFFSMFMARCKLTSADEDDPDGPTTFTAAFRALKKTSGTGYEQTTIQIQDSSLS